MRYRWNRNEKGWIVNRGGNSKGGNLLEPFWTFPHCRFPSPSIHPLFSLPVLDSTQDAVFPPLLSLFPSLVCASLWLPCQLMCGGVSVAGPHPSQTAAWMVPCSVESSAPQILPQGAPDLWWMRIPPPPLAESGTC